MEALGLTTLFGGAYAGRRVLVTGHTGFKGSWLVAWLQALGARVAGYALPPDTDPSHWALLGCTLEREDLSDLRDARALSAAVSRFAPEVVFHLAAQSLVRRGYRTPVETFAINVQGLVHLLEAVRGCEAVRVVVNATTDKVYAPPPRAGGYREEDPLGGRDPYSSSKACAELVTACWRDSFLAARGTRLATARAGNVIGGGDWAEDRLIPDLVRAARDGTALRLRNPNATRPWQHVLEPLSGYLQLGAALLAGSAAPGAWNFGPAADATLRVGEVVARLQHDFPGLQVDLDDGPHPHEAPDLSLDCEKASRELGWRPVWSAERTLTQVARWYRRHASEGGVTSADDLAQYVASARAEGLAWAS